MAYYDQRRDEEELIRQANAGGNTSASVPAGGGPTDADEYVPGPDETVMPGGEVVPQSVTTTSVAAGVAPGISSSESSAAENASEEADLEDWYRYVPKPDYETLARRARRQEQAALLGDIAQIAGQFHGTAGKNGGWIVHPIGNRYQQAREKRDSVESKRLAAWQDYGGKQLSYLMARRKERAAQEAAAQKAKQDYDRFMLEYNYKIADLNRRIKKGDRDAAFEREKLEFQRKKHEDDLALGYAKNSERRRQFDEKQKSGIGGNKIKVFVGNNPDGSRRFVDIHSGAYDRSAGNVWNIMQSKYPDLEQRFRNFILDESRKYPDNFDDKLIAILEEGKTPLQIKTSKNILNFAHSMDDKDVHDFFIDMAGESRSGGVGMVSPSNNKKIKVSFD